jgi:hypothetical protein
MATTVAMEAKDFYTFLEDRQLIDLLEQAKISDDILDVIDLNETQHSDMLAWCLSPDEGHGQGDSVIRHFLHALHIAASAPPATFDNRRFLSDWTPGSIQTSSFGSAFITREYGIKIDDKSKGRLDLFLVDPRNKLVVVIENKVGAKLTPQQLDKYHAAVKAEIAARPLFGEYSFAFVVLDRFLDSYDDDTLDKLGTKWALMDYSWLEAPAKRARLQMARRNHASQLLVAYCQKQTDWQSEAEQQLADVVADITNKHPKVVAAMRQIQHTAITQWTPSMADSTGHRNGLTEHLGWRLVAERLPWSLIQLSGHRVELGLRVA